MCQPKTKEDALRAGAIMQAYGLKYLFSVNPVPQIDKCRFSIVQLGTNGQSHVDFWMPFDDMRRLCEDIDNGVAERRIAADMDSQYPSAYQYAGGENGARRMSIGGGQKGCRVQIQNNVNGRWTTMMTVVYFSALRDMSFYFKLVLGLIPATRYYEGLVDAFWEGVDDRGKIYDATNNNSSHACEEPESRGDWPAEHVYDLTTHGEVTEKEDTLTVDCTDAAGKYTLVFRKDEIKNLPWFGAFRDMTYKRDVHITVQAKRKGNHLFFSKIPESIRRAV